MRTCVIFNPTAKGDKARKFRRHLGEIGADAVLKQTRGVDDARQLATEAVREGFETIVAAGGDGTLNEVLNGIGDAPDGFKRARLGVLPLGTVNVFARELEIPRTLRLAWETIRQGRETIIDLPRVEFAVKEGRASRYFAQLAGAGLDARAIELLNWPLKKRIGPLAYVVAGLSALMQPQSRITVNAGTQSATGELVLIGNGRLYGGQFEIFPEADLRNGRLEVCVFPKVDWLTLARCATGLLWHRKLPLSAARNFQATVFTLTCPTAAALEADGELIGHLPATFSIQKAVLRVIVP
ncbi:MAG: diacylglycerol kinase family lipid kinase [Akkermansiaceae bacterium]|nr:diacylglycerol kinase family lipid kinase [Verrucomicrobiales bacterium]